MQYWEQQGPGAPDLERRFTHPEVMIPVKCDVHAWMRSYIGVLDHPFFAVTDANGSFAIEGLPPGVTELVCHPGTGDQAGTMYRGERAGEVRALCDPRVR